MYWYWIVVTSKLFGSQLKLVWINDQIWFEILVKTLSVFKLGLTGVFVVRLMRSWEYNFIIGNVTNAFTIFQEILKSYF